MVAWQQFSWGCGISLHHFNVISVADLDEVTVAVLVVQHNVSLTKMSSKIKLIVKINY